MVLTIFLIELFRFFLYVGFRFINVCGFIMVLTELVSCITVSIVLIGHEAFKTLVVFGLLCSAPHCLPLPVILMWFYSLFYY